MPQPFRIPGYDFAAPTEEDAVNALTRVFGAERAGAMWAAACRRTFVEPGTVAHAELERVADSLAAQSPACAAVARSIQIRLRTHARLMAKRAALGIGAQS